MDLILELPNVFYVIELKVNHSPKEGLKQIDTQKYYEAILHKGKPVRALAISFLRKKANKKEKIKNIKGKKTPKNKSKLQSQLKSKLSSSSVPISAPAKSLSTKGRIKAKAAIVKKQPAKG